MVLFKPEAEELEEAKELAEEGVERAREVLPKEEEVEIGFGWTEEDFVKERMGGVRGYGLSSTYFEIEFNTEVETWRENVIGSTVHEFGHSYCSEVTGKDHETEREIWHYILEEALTQNLTKRLVPKASEPWREEHSVDEIEEYWGDVKQELGRTYSFPDPLFIDRSDGGYPNWLGYSVSYLIGRQLQEEGYELEDFPELEKEDVVEAGNKLFG